MTGSLNSPSRLGTQASFGFGDRLGCATEGHLAALRQAGGPIQGIFAQQSIREMTRTRRTPHDVMRAASEALRRSGFAGQWSSDADHLKTVDDIRRTMEAGFVFFTLDPSDVVDQQADLYPPDQLHNIFLAIREEVDWIDQYEGLTIRLEHGTLEFDAITLRRAAVKYGRAIQHAIELGRAVAAEGQARRADWELELSIDETAQPTTPEEHYIIADQMQRAGVPLVSLAPRFVGNCEKGVDYKGEFQELRRTMEMHAEIARRLGPYKLSLHSGSDKLSLYPILAQTTRGMFHVKTAGTSYLEALRVAAHHASQLFRRIVEYSRSRYDEDKASYHVSATLDSVPTPELVPDPLMLEQIYLQRWCDVPVGCGFTAPGRQILHCTFGSVITHPELGGALKDLLASRPDEYREVLREHFVYHLQALRAPVC